MVSAYEYITADELEAYAGKDYSTIDSKYTSSIIEANISQAERIVNEYKKNTYSGTIPDDVKAATLIISRQLMKNMLIEDGHGAREDWVVIENFVTRVCQVLLRDSATKYDIKIISDITSHFFTD